MSENPAHLASDADGGDVRCAECGALIHASATTCWLCGARPAAAARERAAAGGRAAAAPTSATLRARQPAAAARPDSPAPVRFSLSTVLVLMTIAAVCLGLAATAPGLAILAAILLAPALIRTTMVVQRRGEYGRRVSAGEKVALIVTSMFVSLVMLTIALVASLGTFCAVCLGGGSDKAIPVAILAAIVATIGVGVLLAKWVRARYRRDVERKKRSAVS